MKKIAFIGAERIAWSKLRQSAYQKVKRAIKKGLLKNLKDGLTMCVDCGSVAYVYDHRDYSKPLSVDPVCRGCNIRRGTNAPTIEEKTNRPECPNCSSRLIYFRLKTKTYLCRTCANVWEKIS